MEYSNITWTNQNPDFSFFYGAWYIPKSSHDGHGTKMEITNITYASLLQNNLSKKFTLHWILLWREKRTFPI